MRKTAMIMILVALIMLVGCEKQKCFMSNGPDTFTKGVVSYEGVEYPDVCIDENMLKNWYCSDDNVKSNDVFCENGCKDGACREKSLICGGYKNIKCPEGYGCDYSEKLVIEELGLCKKEVLKEKPDTTGNYTLRCKTKDRTYFIRNQMMYYTINNYDIILSNVGKYMIEPGNQRWALYPWLNIKKTEYATAVWSIKQGKNVKGGIVCYPVGWDYHPELFLEFIERHPFLYRGMTLLEKEQLNITTMREEMSNMTGKAAVE